MKPLHGSTTTTIHLSPAASRTYQITRARVDHIVTPAYARCEGERTTGASARPPLGIGDPSCDIPIEPGAPAYAVYCGASAPARRPGMRLLAVGSRRDVPLRAYGDPAPATGVPAEARMALGATRDGLRYMSRFRLAALGERVPVGDMASVVGSYADGGAAAALRVDRHHNIMRASTITHAAKDGGTPTGAVPAMEGASPPVSLPPREESAVYAVHRETALRYRTRARKMMMIARMSRPTPSRAKITPAATAPPRFASSVALPEIMTSVALLMAALDVGIVALLLLVEDDDGVLVPLDVPERDGEAVLVAEAVSVVDDVEDAVEELLAVRVVELVDELELLCVAELV